MTASQKSGMSTNAASNSTIPAEKALAAQGVTPYVHLYTKSGDEFDIRARMFAPFDGVPEDPATGAAGAALAGCLAAQDTALEKSYRWRLEQGVEMGRPSLIEIEAEKRAGHVTTIRVGGHSVLVAEGTLTL